MKQEMEREGSETLVFQSITLNGILDQVLMLLALNKSTGGCAIVKTNGDYLFGDVSYVVCGESVYGNCQGFHQIVTTKT